MNVAIVGFSENEFKVVEEKMEELIESSQCFLFNVLISSFDSVGAKWAEKYGAPIIFEKNDMDKLIAAGDYFLMNYDGSPQMHTFIFKVMRSGKHGTVIEKEKWK